MSLQKIVYLSETQLQELFANGSVTSEGVTVNYSPDDLYVTPIGTKPGAFGDEWELVHTETLAEDVYSFSYTFDSEQTDFLVYVDILASSGTTSLAVLAKNAAGENVINRYFGSQVTTSEKKTIVEYCLAGDTVIVDYNTDNSSSYMRRGLDPATHSGKFKSVHISAYGSTAEFPTGSVIKVYVKKGGTRYASETSILSPSGSTHTLQPCPVTYSFGTKEELTVTVTATSQYHFSFTSPAGTPTVLLINGETGRAGDTVEAGKTYEVDIWNGVTLIKAVEVTPVT